MNMLLLLNYWYSAAEGRVGWGGSKGERGGDVRRVTAAPCSSSLGGRGGREELSSMSSPFSFSLPPLVITTRGRGGGEGLKREAGEKRRSE
jgi:hypothetical protein